MDINNEGNLTVGHILKQTREQLGYSVAEVVGATKIRYSHIQLIESNQYSKLPERTYTLGYIARYSKFLGLDPDIMVQKAEKEFVLTNPLYTNMVQNNRLEKKYNPLNILKENIIDFIFIIFTFGLKRYDPEHDKVSSLSGKRRKKFNLLIPLLIVALGVAIGLYFFKRVSKVVVNESPLVIDEKLGNELDLQELQNDLPSNSKSSILNNDDVIVLNKSETNTTGIHDLTPPVKNDQGTPNEKIQLSPWPSYTKMSGITLRFTKNVWVKIYNQQDNNLVYLHRIFKPGEKFDVPQVNNLTMDIGDYKGVAIVVNNEPLYLTSSTSSNVIRKINLEASDLINKYRK